MTRLTKNYFKCCIGVLALILLLSIVVRFSFKGYKTVEELINNEDIKNYSVTIDDDYTDTFCDINDYKELKNISSVIAKIKVCGNRELYFNDAIKTKVNIEKIYKGNIKENEKIVIFEPATISYCVDNAYVSTEGYQLMEDDEEYYVFLQSLKCAKGYKKSVKENNMYTPCTTIYSVIPVKEKRCGLLEKDKLENDEYKYKEVNGLEILTTSAASLNKYQRIKKEFVREYIEKL